MLTQQKYEPKFKKLTIEQGKAFIAKNREKLSFNYFMNYEDCYNNSMMNL